jgi:hypothetical protein
LQRCLVALVGLEADAPIHAEDFPQEKDFPQSIKTSLPFSSYFCRWSSKVSTFSWPFSRQVQC